MPSRIDSFSDVERTRKHPIPSDQLGGWRGLARSGRKGVYQKTFAGAFNVYAAHSYFLSDRNELGFVHSHCCGS